MNDRLLATKNILPYHKDYPELEWFEQDLMSYIDHLKYQNCVSNQDRYFDRAKVLNFDIINNSSRGNPLSKSIGNETISKAYFEKYANKDKEKVISAVIT